ncbi:MAG: DUF1156 domain-containing protein [Oscillochloris sp.]|nr:DUF1156 domain-containing protein [Oscillochloris sp.]
MSSQLPLDNTNPANSPTPSARRDPAGRAFIEVQFPVSKLSKESYKERKANSGQTLTGLGKWWGRKPLALVRGIILGLLLPATDDPERDRTTFLALMTMDDDGMWRRAGETLSVRAAIKEALPHECTQYFEIEDEKIRWRKGISQEQKRQVQRRAFLRMGYDRRLEFCKRPEEINGPSLDAWTRINAHLGTTAQSLPELLDQLGRQIFDHKPVVGDACCGGGSIPFEAARIGCDAYGSDLNPAAALLTWGALNIVGGGEAAVSQVRAAQQRVFDAVRRQVDQWGIERNEQGWIADAYLYCNEVIDPATGWRVPLAPSWVIGMGSKTIARLVAVPGDRRFEIEICQGVSDAELEQAKLEGTWDDGLICPVDRAGHWLKPEERQRTSMDQLRGRDGLRRWTNEDVVPRPTDVFQERLYCIRWVETIDLPDGKTRTIRHYRTPTAADLLREKYVADLLRERFADWQSRGYIPSWRVEPGEDINRPLNARGWTYWHHFFNPRQLLINGLFAKTSDDLATNQLEKAGLLLSMGRLIDHNGRMSGWHAAATNENVDHMFYKPAIGTPLVRFASRPTLAIRPAFFLDLTGESIYGSAVVEAHDTRAVERPCDIWITDPGYADAIIYEEISEFFLSWYDQRLMKAFPNWYSDSKRALAVSGTGPDFRLTLAECYQHLARKMPDNGFQVVMFTHQSADVWADVALVLWAAGLQVTTAWTIATETESAGIKQGNHVQGTVVLVLRKRKGSQRGDLSDLYPDMQTEVQSQLQSMIDLDPKDDPNFGDADYQLAAYAAALRVITSYADIDEINPERELRRVRTRGEKSPFTGLIEQAVHIASDYLVPDGIERGTWRRLGPEERLYLKGISVEASGETREGVYQEYARGYGAGDYRALLGSRAANNVRLKTPIELGSRDLRRPDEGSFGGSLLRYALFSIFKTATDPERDPRNARHFLRQELPTYWASRQTLIELLRYLATRPAGLPHWERDVRAAQLLVGAIEGDSL